MLDLNPPEDAPAVSFNDRPSMLHHLDKTDLESYVIENPHIVNTFGKSISPFKRGRPFTLPKQYQSFEEIKVAALITFRKTYL